MAAWTERERDGRQVAMFDVILDRVVEPLDRVAPSERRPVELVEPDQGEYAAMLAAERASTEDAYRG